MLRGDRECGEKIEKREYLTNVIKDLFNINGFILKMRVSLK